MVKGTEMDKRQTRGAATKSQGAMHSWLFTQKKTRRQPQAITPKCPRCGRKREHDGIGWRCECVKVERGGMNERIENCENSFCRENGCTVPDEQSPCMKKGQGKGKQ
jgi:hypothetical protein